MVATTPAIEVTPAAAQKLGEVLSQQGQVGAMLRVMVMPGPHGAFQYMLGVEEQAQEGDLVVEANAVRVLIDSDSLPLIEGSQIDYVEGLMRSGFVISNPNAPTGQGGCGGGGGGCGCGGGGGGGCGSGGGGGCGCGGQGQGEQGQGGHNH